MEILNTGFKECNKKYVLNMCGKRRMLHIKDTKRCYSSKFLWEYVGFNTIEEVKAEMGDNFSYCGHCFPNK